MTGVSTDAMVLYGGLISPFTIRILALLSIKGVDIPLEPPPGGLHSEEYRRLSPIDKIPALRVGDRILPESEVIAEYLEQRFPHPPLLPQDPWLRAQSRLLSRIGDLYVMNPLIPAFAHIDPAARDTAALAAIMAVVSRGLGLLDHYMADGPWAAGGTQTLADCALAPIVHFAAEFVPLFGAHDAVTRHERLAAYLGRTDADPLIGAALARMRTGIDAYLGR